MGQTSSSTDGIPGGNDAYRFMEQCVTDAQVERILILCDPTFAEKADAREGGVGAETLIIPPEVYQEAEQTKFVPVIMERGDDGGAVRPAYLKSRFYIDLSKPEAQAEGYDRLLRVLYGKPEVVRPELGRRPDFLDSERPVLLTGRALEQYRDALLGGKRRTVFAYTPWRRPTGNVRSGMPCRCRGGRLGTAVGTFGCERSQRTAGRAAGNPLRLQEYRTRWDMTESPGKNCRTSIPGSIPGGTSLFRAPVKPSLMSAVWRGLGALRAE